MENDGFHPHSENQSAVHSSDVKTNNVKVKKSNPHYNNTIKNRENAKKIMNEKLDKAGVGYWYRSLFPNDRSTIFKIAEHKAHADFGDVRFDLYGFPLKHADVFVDAVKTWKVAKLDLQRGHEASTIEGLQIRKKRASKFAGISTKKLETHLKHERDKNEISDIKEELHQRNSGIHGDRLDPKYPARGDPFSVSKTLQVL